MNIRQLYRPLKVKSLLLALVASFALTTSGVAQAQDGNMKPLAVIAFNNVNNLLDDANFIGLLAGKPGVADQVRPIIGMLVGLDTDQPIGLIVQTDGIAPSGVLCLPVKDLKTLLDGVGMFGITREDGPDGTIQIGAQGQTLFAREANGWAYLSMMPQMLDNLPANPGEILNTLTKDYDIAIRVNVQNIPEAYKQMALSQIQAGMEQAMQRRESESDEKFAARQELTKMQIEQFKTAVQEIKELTFGIGVDSENQRTYFDLVYTAITGTNLAKQMAFNSDPKTDYAGFFQPDAAMMMSLTSKATEADLAQADQNFDLMFKQFETAFNKETADKLSDEDREAAKSIFVDFFDALKATVKAGKMDGGAVLNVSPTSFSFVAGGFIADTAKVESGLKKAEELVKKNEPDFPGIDWNSDSHADVQFHTFSIPIPAGEEEAQQMFGATVDVAIGLGKESAYVSIGRDCIEAIKGIINTSAATPQKSVPMMEGTLALTQILDTAAEFVKGDDKAQVLMIANMLANEANGRDHVRMIAQPVDDGIRIRFEAEEGVLRAIGMAVQHAQNAQMEMETARPGGF